MKSLNKKIFNLKNQKKMNKSFVKNKPFEHIIIDDFLNLDTAKEFEKSFKLNSNWTNYSFINNYKKYGLKKKTYFRKKCKETLKELGAKKFVKILENITSKKGLFLDTKLDGGGFHKVLNGGYLNVHKDFSSHYQNDNWKRVLNLLIYFNNDWKKSYNGYLQFYDKNGQKLLKSIKPKFNRCVIFHTNEISYHGHPKKLKLPKNISRKSFAAYYYIKTKEPFNSTSTSYKSSGNTSFLFNLLVNFENYLLKIYLQLKKKKFLNDDKVTKFLNFFNFK
tara:strand:- start:608 stop:1438 length:831 start_codon:yes stop_codon:yes gene_type:complete